MESLRCQAPFFFCREEMAGLKPESSRRGTLLLILDSRSSSLCPSVSPSFCLSHTCVYTSPLPQLIH